jgi:hypothetical protein
MTMNKHWFDIAVKLKENKIAEPVLWIGDHNHLDRARSKFGEEVVKDLDFFKFKSHKISDLNYKGKLNAFFNSTNYLIAKDRSLKMMDRIDEITMLSRLDRETIFHQTVIWTLDKIEKQKPDFLISVENPHSHIQYTILQVCKYYKIPCRNFFSWTYLPVLSVQDSASGNRLNFSKPINSKYLKEFSSQIQSVVDSIYKKNENYKTSHTELERLESKSLIWKTNQLINLFKDTFRKYISKKNYYEYLEYNPLNPFKISALKKVKYINKRRQNILKELNSYSNNKFSLDDKFVYYGLHYEPERSTLPDGGDFHDQLIAILKLRELVPNEIKIYVKEHPSIFVKSLWGYRGRSPLLYRLINEIDNVYIINHKIKTIDLIKNSIFTSTITGTIGFESAIIGKTSIIFGNSWYNGCPNTICWSPNLSYSEILENKIQNKEYIVEFLKNKMMKECTMGLLNSQSSIRFKSFIDDSFYEYQADDIYYLFKDIFKNNINE